MLRADRLVSMTYFEPPPLPGESGRREPAGPQEPTDPYASPVGEPPQQAGWPGPAPAAPWGPPAQAQHPRGTIVLVLGILSVTIMQLLGPVAWVMGHTTLREIDASGRAYANRSSVQAGMILGIIGTAIGVLGLVWLVVMLMAVLASI